MTGANGFVGGHLCEQLGQAEVLRFLRHAQYPYDIGVGDIAAFDAWGDYLQRGDVIVHLAGRVQQVVDSDPEAYWRDNVEVIERMAKAAVLAKAKRFVFISSIKVNGEYTDGQAFTPFDQPAGEDDYGRSKCEAEQVLKGIARHTELEIVIIRPPLVYGPGVKGNFSRLMKLACYPLPFGSVNNCRDMVSVYNLCDLIVRCIDHPAAKHQTFLVSDGHPYSLAELLSVMCHLQGKRCRLWPFTPSILRYALSLVGKGDFARRLFDDLEVDISHTIDTLDWRPQYTLEYTLRKMS